MFGRLAVSVSLVLLLVPSTAALAQATSPAAIAASVGDDSIEVAEVRQMMDVIFPDKKPSADLLPMAQAQVLEEIINRRLVLAYARRVGDTPSPAELAKAKKQLEARLLAQGRKVSDVLKAELLSPVELERRVLWRPVWDRYLAKYRTAERRQKWFEVHHRDLDGTELVVSHILLKPAAGAGAKEIEALEKHARSIRDEITSGKLDFAAAAEKYSDGPSRAEGGRLGKIGRHAPMDEAFSRAAFELQAGEISPPVRSPFGVHLIRCDKVVPGAQKLAELTAPIDDALAKELLAKISQHQRRQTPVEYSAVWPHFKPGTLELAK